MKRITLFILIAVSLMACKTSKTNMAEDILPAAVVQKAIVYKTYRDFNNLVPIIMNDSKTQIISYPHPQDLMYDGSLATPIVLKNGYLLDNRGVNKNVVFTSFTYDEYAALDKAPSLEELKASIREKYPLVELYDCGARYQYVSISDLNELIDAGFPNCEKVNIKSMQVNSNLLSQ